MRKQLKGLRFIFLMNQEGLPEDARLLLNNIQGDFQELGEAYLFKEALRMISMRVKTSYHANIVFIAGSNLLKRPGFRN